jgi:hypothetical protein
MLIISCVECSRFFSVFFLWILFFLCAGFLRGDLISSMEIGFHFFTSSVEIKFPSFVSS